MDTTTSTHKLPVHKHPLLLSARFFLAECGGCHVTETMYGGYFCNEASCNRWFHKECAEAPLEINHHPSHPEHPLLLTIDSPARGDDTPCDSCGQKILSPCYTCPTCGFSVDLICGIKPSPSVIEHPVSHDHPLVFFKKREEKEVPCEVCNESIGGPFYSCLECNDVYFHLDCVHLSEEVHHPCHSSHPLTIITAESICGFVLGCALCSTSSVKYYHSQDKNKGESRMWKSHLTDDSLGVKFEVEINEIQNLPNLNGSWQ
ncbi:hypothetical protein Bca4012_085930 [Brassica carinata]|uniref:DC1 domain-containing protein n=1 Tax=Brassica carinata TaxID=52824 RepID=A0A8X7QRI4_BRACI|nr:hypothetical protein Bca52824_067655 [Brassica carinata]